jgi:3-dehydroquinate dehydratase I
MIFTCIGKTTFPECLGLLESLACAEIRLDMADFSLEQVERLFSLPRTLIATCRPGRHTVKTRAALLLAAIRAGAGYVDLDLEEPLSFRRLIQNDASRHDCRLILSYHNFERTPPLPVLKNTVERCFAGGAGIAKIACQVQSTRDASRLISLYDRRPEKNRDLLAIGMGKRGRWTRVVAPFLGAPFTFAAAGKPTATAAGQFDRATLESIYRLMRRGGT